MAQYQRNFYSSSLYGRINAFYGEYLTEVFDGQEPFSSKVNASILVQLPSVFYSANQREFSMPTVNSWTLQGSDLKTRTINAPLEFLGTGDSPEVHVRMQSQGIQNIEAKLYKEEEAAGTFQWALKQTKSIPTLSQISAGQIAKIVFDPFGYGNYKIVIAAKNSTGDAIVAGVKIRTSDLTVSIRTSANKSTWSNWEALTLTRQVQGGEAFLVSGQSSITYSNIRYVQGKIELYASDSKTSPVIDRVELRSDDSGLYDYNGEYTVKLDMAQVATLSGKQFKHMDRIRWTENIPAPAEMVIRSSSSRDNIFWGPISAPYKKNTKRLRLKRGITSHSLTLGPINEGARFSYGRTAEILSWNTQAYSPKDPSDTKISYIFSKTKSDQRNPLNKLKEIGNPMNVSDRSLLFSPQPYFLTVELTRSAVRGTPVVDLIDIDQMIQYTEKAHVIDKDITAVDGEGNGIKGLQKIGDYAFVYPSPAGHIAFNQDSINRTGLLYSLSDNTKRPNDVQIYFKSEEKKGTRTNTSNLASDEVIAKVIHRRMEMGEKTGIISHYQYGAGRVQYLRPYDREVDSTFTPSLNEKKRYRYFLKNGWPSDTHIVVQGQTMADVANMYEADANEINALNGGNILANEDGTLVKGQSIKIPNNTSNADVSLRFKNGTAYTMKSSHNALYDQSVGLNIEDFSSEQISVSVPAAPPKGYVDWVSEEKIYSGVINFNDIREEFVRTQFNRSSYADFTREYTVQAGETWDSVAAKHDIHSFDLKLLNEGTDLQEGVVLKIPPNIILPALAPEAEFDGDNPYEVSIIPDSVHKKSGQRVDESFIPIDWEGKHLPLTVTYRDSEVLTAELTRGSDKNGMDPLPLSHVNRIVSIKRGTVTYHEWNGSFGDFKLTSNYIDWSPNLSGSLEPAAGEAYTVTYIRSEVDTLRIHLDTNYYEKSGADIVWRSPEVKVFDGVCTPSEDFRMELPSPESFEGYSAIYQNVGYVIEDNDLWVVTKIENSGDKMYLVGTLNGKDPAKNWHPTINTGYYYLKEQEHYLYSEPMKTVLDEKELPAAINIEYVNGAGGIGALLLPSGQNIVKDSVFEATEFKNAKVFSSSTI
ncbi:LysM peptidoglycan-binding domain-containing protein [Cytobacillus oceanisediminis]|uniref:LysM peptidoglycan-binding domain-containing protein n=1 Tax=Cytobacillus oceanisediminis TaxID=665099 RepID=UPI001FB22BD2|nr:LysM domain-containing protein [Cytobacillus oceanisediminis]UOE58069.1 DUF4815 domain-containing protein [Cytobacillus oceanisediminis]